MFKNLYSSNPLGRKKMEPFKMKGPIRSLGNTALSAVPARRSRVNNNNYYVLSHHTLIHINFLPFPQIGGYINII